jgi:hypothetical protein
VHATPAIAACAVPAENNIIEMNIWAELDIQPTKDVQAIKGAYAKRLRQTQPEDDAGGFQRLRLAYEQAIRWAGTALSAALDEPSAESQAEPSNSSADQMTARPTPSAQVRDIARAYTAAQELIDLAASAPLNERRAAVAECLTRPDWEGLDFRKHLEHFLAHILTTEFDQNFQLVELFASLLGWGSQIQSIQQEHRQIAALMDRYELRRYRLETEQATSPSDKGTKRAFRILSSPPDSESFSAYIESPENLQSMYRLLEKLRSMDPEMVNLELNQDCVQWWIAREGRLASKHRSANTEHDNARLKFLIPLLIMLAMKLLAGVILT